MAIVPCSKCGNLFRMVNNSVCPDCLSEKEDVFEIIKEYLYNHPNLTIPEIAEGAGVDESLVLDFVNAGRLVSKGGRACDVCGKPVDGNTRICKNCARI